VSGTLDLEKIRFEAFTEAFTRLRWFLMITTLLSSLILCHIYLEADGFQTHQLSSLRAYRVREQIDEKRACSSAVVFKKETAEACKRVAEYWEELRGKPYEEQLQEWSGQEFRYKRTDNTWDKMQIGERDVPLLGMKISVNDYLPVMAVLLMTFSMGVWLSFRSVAAALSELTQSSSPDVVRAARLFFTFTVPLDGNTSDRVVRLIARLALWLPFIALVIAIILDLLPVMRVMYGVINAHVGRMPDLTAREILLLVCTLICMATALGCSELRVRIDSLIATDQSAAEVAS